VPGFRAAPPSSANYRAAVKGLLTGMIWSKGPGTEGLR